MNTMKKTYIIPQVTVEQVLGEQMLAVSGVKSISNDVNIGYGGVDEGGSLEADVKGDNAFDFSWE